MRFEKSENRVIMNWELLVLSRKVLLMILFVIFNQINKSIESMLLALILLTIIIFWFLNNRPFKSKYPYILGLLGNLALIVFILSKASINI